VRKSGGAIKPPSKKFSKEVTEEGEGDVHDLLEGNGGGAD
jgi:hypothetical protein